MLFRGNRQAVFAVIPDCASVTTLGTVTGQRSGGAILVVNRQFLFYFCVRVCLNKPVFIITKRKGV